MSKIRLWRSTDDYVELYITMIFWSPRGPGAVFSSLELSLLPPTSNGRRPCFELSFLPEWIETLKNNPAAMVLYYFERIFIHYSRFDPDNFSYYIIKH
jgi:hypothetical protein